MRILILNQFCTPEPNFKSVPFARELARRGHEVRILTGFPNYPGGAIYRGYRLRLFQRETIDGIPILRVPLFPSHDRSVWRRGLNYGSFGIASLPALLGGWRPDVIYIYNALDGVFAALAKTLRGVPYVLDIQDLWPDSIFAAGMGRPWMERVVSRALAYAYRHATRVVVLSPGFKDVLIRRGVPASKLEVIYNWCDEDALLHTPFANLSAAELPFKGRFTILYAGNLGAVQGLDTVIDAATQLRCGRPDICFAIMGQGIVAEQLKEQVARLGLDNVTFLPARPIDQVASVLRAADALLIHLKSSPLFDVTIPSKTQAYLALEKPILMAVRGDAAEVVRRAEAGILTEPGNAGMLAEAAIRLADMSSEDRATMGRRGGDWYRRESSLSVGVGRFEIVFLSAVNSQASTTG